MLGSSIIITACVILLQILGRVYLDSILNLKLRNNFFPHKQACDLYGDLLHDIVANTTRSHSHTTLMIATKAAVVVVHISSVAGSESL